MQSISQLLKGELKGAISVKISEDLEHFPEQLFDLADTLEYLDLSSNKLNRLPHDFGRLKKLKIFFASDNLFTVLPEVLGNCPDLDIVGFKSNRIEVISPKALNPNLRWLILTNNKIDSLPPGIGNCVKLQKLMLAGNRLTSLPKELMRCKNLALLRISANYLKQLPQWLISMPSLSWLAFSGNQIRGNFAFNNIPTVDFERINIKELLGEGASGSIYRASKLNNHEVLNVAVKIFKGNVTSDGYPEDEMNAYIAAGYHPAIVKLIGKIDLSHENQKGLVMDLIPSNFYNLGRPPSLQTCTRDVFNVDIELSLEQILEIAISIASVGFHLHSRGIIHGDLYAHNILINNAGKALFGDFGAASFYDRENATQSFYIERIEVKAYGYLLDDLLSLCGQNTLTFFVDEMCKLRDNCLSPNHHLRPDFKAIVEKLETLKNN
ncbi:protein kinase [Pedobacter chinensis]|uniref:Protein kinase n=1 Tax=Pedobacter chinensis TaxID=2282421 RepID=A0A369PTX2_9SPHI|nr:leucine-rich repeat-containing protein kinase family protein [Pedobacter chinensis]RDC54705.1 protein kinase [Pedobacter chinensis]